MAKIADVFVLIATILTTLLVIGVVLVEIDVLDTTLAAGIIAFWGAVIGGSLTLIGVTKTIEENRLADFKRRIPERVTNAEELIKFYKDFLKIYTVSKENVRFFKPGQKRFDIKKLESKYEPYNKALLVSPSAYKQVKEIINAVQMLTDIYFLKVHAEGVELTEQEKIEHIERLIEDCYNLIYKGMWNLEREQEKYLTQYH